MKTRKPTEIPAALKTIDVKAILRRRGIYLEQKVNRELKEAAIPLAKEIVKSRARGKSSVDKPRHHQFSNEIVLDYWQKQIHVVEVLEKKFDVKLQQFIGKVIDGFLTTLDTEVTSKKDYFSDHTDDLVVQAQLDFTPLLVDQAVLAGQEALKLIGSDDIYTPFELRKRIAESVEKFAQSMIDTDKETLTNIVSDGVADGKSVAEIRGSIQASFDSITKNQAQRITRTEVLRVSNQAAIDAWEQSGVVEGKQWLTAGAVDECAQYEGKVEVLSGPFYKKDTEFMDGNPPLHPNCRCVVLPVLIGEKAYQPPVNEDLYKRIKELESQVDKRTKAYKQLKSKRYDDTVYIKSLEKHLGIDEPPAET